MEVFESSKDGYILTNAPDKINVEDICDLIGKQYWGPNRTRRTTRKAIENSQMYVLLSPEGTLVGCVRFVTDFATVCYIEDVVIDESLRGKGLGEWMMREIMAAKENSEQHRYLLLTVDAQTFYQKLGFAPLEHPDWAMELTHPYPKE